MGINTRGILSEKSFYVRVRNLNSEKKFNKFLISWESTVNISSLLIKANIEGVGIVYDYSELSVTIRYLGGRGGSKKY